MWVKILQMYAKVNNKFFFYNILLHTKNVLHILMILNVIFEVQTTIYPSGICEILLHIFWACDLHDNPAMT